MKNNTRKMKGSGKRRRVEELPELESVLESNQDLLKEGAADEVIETFTDFLISLNNIDDKLLAKSFHTKNDDKLTELSNKRTNLSIIKVDVADKLLKVFGSKAKHISQEKKIAVFDDELADILSSLKI
jgi:hypothetical protein